MGDRSVKAKLRQYFLENVGVIVNSRQLGEVSKPASEWARRVRELREEEGWPISTHNDDDSLKPGEYRLESVPGPARAVEFKRVISQRLRAEVLERDGYTCQMCGTSAGDLDAATGRPTRLHVGHIVDKSFGGTDDAANLRALCSSCNQGAKNLTPVKPDFLRLKAHVKRASNADQFAIYEWLGHKFGKEPD